MNLDPGLIIVIIAVLVFYLRLIIVQRQRVKQARTLALNHAKAQRAGKQKGKKAAEPPPAPSFAILSRNKNDWIIAGAGAALVVLGILLNTGIIPVDWAWSFWWLPTALGIVAFSWGFR